MMKERGQLEGEAMSILQEFSIKSGSKAMSPYGSQGERRTIKLPLTIDQNTHGTQEVLSGTSGRHLNDGQQLDAVF